MQLSSWSSIRSPEQAAEFIDLIGHLHDGCLREIHVFTETFVSDDLRMTVPGHRDTSARMLFHRQSSQLAAVELAFTEISSLILKPTPDNADSIINHASLEIRDGVIEFSVWCIGLPLLAVPNSVIESEDGEPFMQIKAQNLKWRPATQSMGPELTFLAKYGDA